MTSCNRRIAVLRFPWNDSHFRQSLDVLRQRSNLRCCDTHQQSSWDGWRSGTCSHPSPTSTTYPIFIAFYDAAWTVRKDGKSQGGLCARWRQSAHITSVVLVTQVCFGWPRWSLGCEVRSAHRCGKEPWTEHVLSLVTDCKGMYGSMTMSMTHSLKMDPTCDRHLALRARAMGSRPFEKSIGHLDWVLGAVGSVKSHDAL